MNQTMVLRAGAGKSQIRYPAEFFPQEHICGIRDCVHARAVLLEYSQRVLIVSLELPSLRPFTLVDEMREKLEGLTGIDRENIWICMTHNLSGPHVPDRDSQPEKYEIHMGAVWEAVKDACGQAAGNVREARLGIGTGEAFVNGNRDIYTNQGWWMGAGGEGVSDKTLTVFLLETPDKEPIAVLYHYALKPSAAEGIHMENGMRLLTSDVSGMCSRCIEKKTGVPALFFMGAAGDQVPRKKGFYGTKDEYGNLKEVDLGEKAYEFVDELGEELGEAVVKTVGKIRCSRKASVMRILHRSYWLPGQKPYSGGRPYRPVLQYQYIPDMRQELKAEILCLGDAVLFGLQPETTAVIGIELRKRTYLKPLLIAMVNGGKDYMADQSAYDRNTFAGTHSVFARGAAEEFLDRAEELLKELEELTGGD